jgi:hypothetical protein
MLLAGDCWRLALELGSIKLCLFLSRWLVTLDRLKSETGDSARVEVSANDGTLPSLSAPASESRCIETRLLRVSEPMWERGVLAPLGLLDRVEAVDAVGSEKMAEDRCAASLRDSAMDEGASSEQENMSSVG